MIKRSCKNIFRILSKNSRSSIQYYIRLTCSSSTKPVVMEEEKKKIDLVKKNIKRYPDFPKPGIVFLDIFSVLRHSPAFKALQEVIIGHVRKLQRVDVITALESRGFLFGPMVALELGLPFVPIRKKGKLPGKVEQVSFTLEYGTDVFEVQTDSINPGQSVLILDDLLATGGSLAASCQLISQLKAQVVQCIVVIELVSLKGRDKIPAPVHSIIQETEDDLKKIQHNFTFHNL